MNTQIEITQNGTTTLATAGKYCDRNIDVNVEVVSGGGADVEAQKAITESLVNRTITEYSSDTLTEIGVNAFYYCQSLHTLNCPNVLRITRYGLGHTAIQKIDFSNLQSIYDYAFAESNLDTLIIRWQGICTLKGTTAFNNTPIKNGTGFIYVPDNIVEKYKTATNWATFANQIKPISELEE